MEKRNVGALRENVLQPYKQGNPDTHYTTWTKLEDIMLHEISRNANAV